jgi:putative addiction module component (TIGR02574 family)
MTIDQIVGNVLRLGPHDRAMLAEILWESLEDPYFQPFGLSEQEAIALSQQRDQEIEQGKVTPLSHAQLMARLRDAH